MPRRKQLWSLILPSSAPFAWHDSQLFGFIIKFLSARFVLDTHFRSQHITNDVMQKAVRVLVKSDSGEWTWRSNQKIVGGASGKWLNSRLWRFRGGFSVGFSPASPGGRFRRSSCASWAASWCDPVSDGSIESAGDDYSVVDAVLLISIKRQRISLLCTHNDLFVINELCNLIVLIT